MNVIKLAGQEQPPPTADKILGGVNRPLLACRSGDSIASERYVADEVPVALTYNGASYAVMLATPTDLEDFAIGFSLTEGIVDTAAEIEDVAVTSGPHGLVLQMWLPAAHRERLLARRRYMAGPAGCGLCGIDSLAEAARRPVHVGATARFLPQDVSEAMTALAGQQPLGRQTRAVHAAGLWRPGRGMVAVREDVGRHNALDKLAGALARAREAADGGILVLTSRISVELVQKAARVGAGVLAAISAPTALAIDMADAANLTLVAVARHDGFELYTQAHRLRM